MRIFSRNEEAVSPVIGVILMVAITVILAAVIAAFVFGMGGTQNAAPTASIVAANYPDSPGADMKIQHKGGDMLKGGEWKLSIVEVGNATAFNTSVGGNDLSVGAQIIANITSCPEAFITNQTVTAGGGANCIGLISTHKYDVKLVHIPSNAMLLDQVIEVR